MKAKPDNWKDIDIRRKMDFIMGRGTSVCNCTPSLGEHCKRCDAVPDIKEEDRNYHEEMLLLLRDMENNSRQPEIYSMLRVLYEVDDEEDFNRVVREIGRNVTAHGEDGMEIAFSLYHKTLRQYDHYNHLQITNTKTKDFVSAGCFQSLLYDLIYISEVPYNMMKKLLTL